MSAEALEMDRLRRLVDEAPQVVEPSPKIAAAITVYVSIGNSDDKLTQRQWSDYVADLRTFVAEYAGMVYGDWLAEPSSRYQNACFAFELLTEKRARAREHLAELARFYGQEAITWAEATTTFVTPPGAGHNPHTWGGDRG